MSPRHLAHLKRFGLLRMLPGRELKRILGIARQVDFGPGERIFSKAEAGDHMFVVIKGRVRIFLGGGGRRRKTFAYMHPGDFFGEMAVIEGKGRTASAEAVEPTSLLMVHKRDFQRLLRDDHKFCLYLLEAVIERLRQANEEIEDLLFRNVLGRVAKVLRGLSPKAGRADAPIELPRRYTHQDLADMVGTTREPLSRAMATLRRAGLVHGDSGRLTLLDPAKLDRVISASVCPD
ncbi:MAG: Crp/Fnr family transcriptional regulator [Elusimicrobia bacterium]|nr:Crp/Fnr family transcriptional regulator [Elusimicrobiota bacterium]